MISYGQMRGQLRQGRTHILLGNGFSTGCDSIFSYSRLYDAAVNAGLSGRAQQVFQRQGTNNFEGVMRLLEDANWIAGIYGLRAGINSSMLDDVEIVKRTLVEAVAQSHLEHTGKVPEFKKDAALAFLSPYYNVFTTNYDLLSYWVNMHSPAGPQWQDGFRSDEEDPEAPYVVFTERLGSQRGLFYIHGALHLYVSRGELRKHTWNRTGKPLTQLIREGLEERQYPLFVAEGSAEGKLEQIQRVGYLWYCLDKLAKIEGPLVVFGHSLGASDQHISDVIADNHKLEFMAVALHGNEDSASNQGIKLSVSRILARREALKKRKRKTKSLEVVYFDSNSANVWGGNNL